MVFSVDGSRCSTEVPLFVGRSLNTIVNLVFADDEGWLVVVDVAVKSFEFLVAMVYVPNITRERERERASFFLWLAPFLYDLK